MSSLSIEVGQISTRVTNVDSRLGTAESSIVQQVQQITQKVRNTDYNGNTIASLINQTSTTITIQASKINLVGAVRVLSDFSEIWGIYVGSIIGGSIQIDTDARVGNNLYIGQPFDSNSKSIVFNNSSRINSIGNGMSLSA